MRLFFIALAIIPSLIFAQGKHRGIEYRPLNSNTTDNRISCTTLYDQITTYGKDHGSYYNENFNWLESIDLYRLDGKVYIVAWLKVKRKVRPYLYCDVQRYEWDLFANSLDFEYAFNRYIKKFECDCR